MEKKEMTFNQLKWGLIAISFSIFIFVLIKVFGETTGIALAFFVVFPLFGVFLILNGRRFIKYRRWYLGPDFLGYISFIKFFSEETLAWMHILSGTFFLVVILGIIVWAILSL